MKIDADKVVTFHYRLSDPDGTELETSHGDEPVVYLQGHGQIVSGLENEMTGKVAGESFSITILPEQAYGAYQPAMQQRVPVKHLVRPGKLEVGQMVRVNTQQGVRMARVAKVGHFNVDVDFNHPMAGRTLQFAIDVVDVRDATEEELAHGHAHGPGDHHH